MRRLQNNIVSDTVLLCYVSKNDYLYTIINSFISNIQLFRSAVKPVPDDK